jgi:hypothetical protein
MKRVLVFAFFCVLTLPCIASCGFFAPPDGYLSKTPTSVYYLQFTEQSGQLSGHLQGIYETNTIPPSEQTMNYPFTGVHVNNSISLTLTEYFFFHETLTGTFDGSTVVLQIPQSDGYLTSETFGAASNDDYNAAVNTLRTQVTRADVLYQNQQATATSVQDEQQATAVALQATQQALQQQQQAVTDANQTLGNDITTLQNDAGNLSSFSEQSTLTGYANDWQTMQNDYAVEENDAKQGCANGNGAQVGGDLAQVNGDKAQINGDDAQLQGDEAQYTGDVTPVQQDIEKVKADWKVLQQAVASNSSGEPVSAYNNNDVNKAIHQANSDLSAIHTTLTNAQSQAENYDQESSALVTQATTLDNNMGC